MLWWIGWMTIALGSFFLGCWFWTPIVAKYFGSIRSVNASLAWLVAVFGTWMIFLLPLMVVMYTRVDRMYEEVRARREEAQAKAEPAKAQAKSISVNPDDTKLDAHLSAKLKNVPEIIKGGQLVTLLLKDGRQIPHVFIKGGEEIAGIYEEDQLSFSNTDIADVEPTNLDQLPEYTEERWLRFDVQPAT